MPAEPLLDLFVITAPGIEHLTAGELLGLGLTPGGLETGGISLRGNLDTVARANLWLRTGSRVIVRAGGFHARALGELTRRAARLPWARFIAPGIPVRIRVTTRKSRLYHQGAIAEHTAEAIAQVTGAESFTSGGSEEEDEDTEQLVLVRLLRDECTISVDTSGALLHRRGYRLATGKAPLRETLGAALILASGWDRRSPLVDPFCGSGTIPIEAGLLARDIAPGMRRDFAFLHWPELDLARWRGLVEEAESRALAEPPAPVMASDRDAGAVRATRSNAERAGVADSLLLAQRPFSGLTLPPGPGAIVTNPPYGVRVGEPKSVRDLFGRFGEFVRRKAPDYSVTLLVPSQPLERATSLSLHERFRTRNGGLLVRAVSTAAGGAPVPITPPGPQPAARPSTFRE